MMNRVSCCDGLGIQCVATSDAQRLPRGPKLIENEERNLTALTITTLRAAATPSIAYIYASISVRNGLCKV